MSSSISSLPELKITVFSDYICPFCYLGDHRLFRLHDSYDLKINWCFLQIHPETPVSGDTIDNLGYSTNQWKKMLNNLERIANEENIPLANLTFIANSKDALLLAEATKQCGREIFYTLHHALFHAYFVDGKNIGDREYLKEIAKACDISEKVIESAWQDLIYQQRLSSNFKAARQLKIQGVPSFVFGEKVLTGVVTESSLRQAAIEYLQLNIDD